MSDWTAGAPLALGARGGRSVAWRHPALPRVLTAGAALGATAVLATTLGRHGLHADDAWMFVRYADHWLAHGAIAWNPEGPATFGTTSLLHLALVAAARALGAGTDAALGAAVALAAGAGLAVVLVRAHRALAPHPVLLAAGLAVAAYWSATASFRIHASSGMDTHLAVLANLLLFEATRRAGDRLDARRAALFVAAAAGAVLARPDGAIGVLTGAAWLAWLHRGTPRTVARRVLAPLALGALAGVAALTAHFGSPLPLPLWAKTGDLYEGLPAFYTALPRSGLREWTLTCAPLLALLAACPPERRTLALGTATIAGFVVYAFQVTWVMGYEARFLVPAIGPLLGLVLAGLERDRRSGAPAPDTRALVALGLAAAAGAGLWLGFHRVGLGVGLGLCVGLAGLRALGPERVPREAVALVAVAVLVAGFGAQRSRALLPPLAESQPFFSALSDALAELPDDVRIAATEHGLLGALSPGKRVLDLAGLHDPVMARGFDPDRLFDFGPDLLLMPRWVYRGMLARIEGDPRFARDYEVLHRSDPAVGAACRREHIGVALRRDSQHLESLRSAVRSAARQANAASG